MALFCHGNLLCTNQEPQTGSSLKAWAATFFVYRRVRCQYPLWGDS